jgi:hypothetical protein
MDVYSEPQPYTTADVSLMERSTSALAAGKICAAGGKGEGGAAVSVRAQLPQARMCRLLPPPKEVCVDFYLLQRRCRVRARDHHSLAWVV